MMEWDESEFVPDYMDSCADPPAVVGSKKGSLCALCGINFQHLKRHSVRHHICASEWWFLSPLTACWTCKRQEIPKHVKTCGPFDPVLHMDAFREGFVNFLEYLRLRHGVVSDAELLALASSPDSPAHFSAAERQILQELDVSLGTPLSSLLHWRTLVCLLFVLPVTDVPVVSQTMAEGGSNLAEAESEMLLTESSLTSAPLDLDISRINLTESGSVGVGYFDSHCHLDRLFRTASFRGDLRSFLHTHSASDESLLGCLTVFCDPNYFCEDGFVDVFLLDDGVYGAVGCHPKSAHLWSNPVREKMVTLLRHPKVCAVGEIGLDYDPRLRLSFSQRRRQREVFRELLRLAVDLGKPVVVHCRDAYPECLDLMRESLPADWPVHIHCFLADWATALLWLDTFPNSVIGLTPAVAGRNPLRRELARRIPLSRLVLETDAPYFVPPGLNRRYSDPTACRVVADVVAWEQGVSTRRVWEATTENAMRVYGIV